MEEVKINKEQLEIAEKLIPGLSQMLQDGYTLEGALEKLNKEHTANDDLTTAELCSELQNREGVNHIMVDPYAIKEVTIKVEGPARVFIVYD